MSAAQHTPAPWAVMSEEEDATYIRVRGTRLGERFKIANVCAPVYEDSEVYTREHGESRANARLIAAAPELFEALTFAVRFFDQLTPSDAERMRKVLEKVGGAA